MLYETFKEQIDLKIENCTYPQTNVSKCKCKIVCFFNCFSIDNQKLKSNMENSVKEEKIYNFVKCDNKWQRPLLVY